MKLALFGYGGHAREVAVQINKEVTFFVDDEYSNDITKPISEFNPELYLMMVAVENVKIGEGSFIGAYSILTTNIKIGNHAILNRGNQIGHDTVIGDYFSAMPGAIVSGNVVIENKVYLGTNSSIKEKVHIFSNIKIGSNAAVIENIITGGTYVGVPAKFKKK